jgi:hypothetical protein
LLALEVERPSRSQEEPQSTRQEYKLVFDKDLDPQTRAKLKKMSEEA